MDSLNESVLVNRVIAVSIGDSYNSSIYRTLGVAV